MHLIFDKGLILLIDFKKKMVSWLQLKSRFLITKRRKINSAHSFFRHGASNRPKPKRKISDPDSEFFIYLTGDLQSFALRDGLGND
jgi:ribosomal protein L35